MIETPRILIVDDGTADADVEAIIRSFRKAGKSASIRLVRSLMEFRLVAADDPPDIALMEMELPDGNALDLLKSPERPGHFPILIMSSHADARIAVKSLKAGALDFIIKSQDALAVMPLTVANALSCWDMLKELELNRDILSRIDEAVVVVDRDYRITSGNRAFSEKTGIPLKELAGRYCYQASFDLSRPCHEFNRNCACKRTFETGEPTLFVRTVTDQGGEKRHLETKTYAMKDRAGEIRSVIEITSDVTEKTRLEAQLRHSLKMEAIGVLAAGIAHDFSNVLSAVIGYSHLALMKMSPDDPQRDDILNILEGANRAVRLTKDLLIFSRKEASERAPVDLNDIIRHLARFLERVIGDDIACEFSLHKDPIVVLADSHHMEQMLMNLATNARDAMAGGGRFTISSKLFNMKKSFVDSHGFGEPGKYALVTVSDTGEGMSGEIMQKIFDPFYTTKAAGKGTGLGLSVAYGIVKEHDGFINVYSEPGLGTTFRIYLPIIPSRMGGVTEAVDEETLPRGSETILLAEDNVCERELTRSLLEKLGYRVIGAADGEEAVKRFMEQRDSIDLLLFDIVMPGMNGKEAYNEIRPWRPEIKVVFMSGYAPEVVRQRMQFEDNESLVDKPVSMFQLSKEIRRVLDGSGKQE